MTHPSEIDFQEHVETQKQLSETINQRFQKMEQEYMRSSKRLVLIEQFKELIRSKIEYLYADKKISLVLVDIQNDFVLDGYALCSPGNENTVTSNMALLDAVQELMHDDQSIAGKIEIVTSQDAHVLNRDMQHIDSQIMAQSSYGFEKTRQTIKTEQTELEPLNPIEGKFGLHCIVGTVGTAISAPIEKRLQILSPNVAVHRFGKINFSGPEAGMKMRDDVRLDDPALLHSNKGIYQEPGITYSDFFKKQDYKDILISGICGDVCVQQAALGLEALEDLRSKITVLDPAVTYLGIPTYAKARSQFVREYMAADIDYFEISGCPSNPTEHREFNVSVYDQIRYEDLVGKNVSEADRIRYHKLMTHVGFLQFIKGINDLELKRNDFNHKEGYEGAVKELTSLIKELRWQLIHSSNEHFDLLTNRVTFKAVCQLHIDAARPELERHRGNHPVIMHVLDIIAKMGSLLASVLTLGVVPYLTGRNPSRLFPFFETATAQKLDEFEIALNSSLKPQA